ncbi:hypothetical protein [Cryptosporangium aurantiacum]|uniref:Uncharacterized protein n=1 Tax=Cryptosporangium aurantiacum TaxID=134849 RepID=A0A1M7M859_9ACTN|nr:hypothetical protein [Cryptosporangium aurantiacum]SHM86447.1 hypothetical protein SAMN05443668_1021 [Cryptosporangium aurantiacum]
MDYALTLEVVRIAEQFHEEWNRATEGTQLTILAAARNQTCEDLPAEAELLLRQLTSIQCLRGRPDLAEHFLDGDLSE